MRPVRNVFQKLSRTEQRREGVVAYLCTGESFLVMLGGSRTQLRRIRIFLSLPDPDSSIFRQKRKKNLISKLLLLDNLLL